jgi:uncharacterized protein (DUF2141 family)
MRLAAFLLIGLATVATAEAQSGAPRVAFLPMPNTLPAMLFSPDPLAGTMLRPLTGPTPNSSAFVEVDPVPAVVPVATVAPLPDPPPPPEATPAPDAEPEAAAPSDPVPEMAAVAPEEPVPEPEPAPPAPATTTVTVIVENVETDSGNVNVAICDKDLSREGCPYIREVRAHLGFVETQFKDIPPGNYAVVGYHDVNGNDEFDKMLGIPREPYALSGRAAEKMVPTFADAALPIKSGENAIIIRLKRLGG